MTDALVRIKGHYASGRTFGWGHHVRTSDSAGTIQSNMVTWLTALWTNGTNGIETLFPTTTHLDSLDVTVLNTSQRFVSRLPASVLTLAGTDSAAGLPDEVSAVVSFRTANVGRGQISHAKLPAPGVDTVSSGELSTTAATRIGDAFTDFLSTANGAGTQLYFFNRDATLHDPIPLTIKIISAAEGSTKFGTEKSRVKGVRASFFG